MEPSPKTKVCRSCAETINAMAWRCPYCQRSQNLKVLLLGEISLSLFTSALIVGVAVTLANFFTSGRDFSRHQRDIIVLEAATRIEPAKYQTNVTNIVVFGTLTNAGKYEWELNGFEVRFYDTNQSLIDVMTGGTTQSVLPHSQSGFRLAIYGEKSYPPHASVKVSVTSARDPSAW